MNIKYLSKCTWVLSCIQPDITYAMCPCPGGGKRRQLPHCCRVRKLQVLVCLLHRAQDHWSAVLWLHLAATRRKRNKKWRAASLFCRILILRQVELHVSGQPVLVGGRVQRASGGSRMHPTETWNGLWWRCRSTTVRNNTTCTSSAPFNHLD